MFWIGMLVGMIIAIGAIVGFLAYCCMRTYGDVETFSSMVEVTHAAATNRESRVVVYHDGETLEEAIFKEI